MNHVHFDVEKCRSHAREQAAAALAAARALGGDDTSRQLVDAQEKFIPIVEAAVVGLAEVKNAGLHPRIWSTALGMILGSAASTACSSTSSPDLVTQTLVDAFCFVLNHNDDAETEPGHVRTRSRIDGETGGRA